MFLLEIISAKHNIFIFEYSVQFRIHGYVVRILREKEDIMDLGSNANLRHFVKMSY